MKRRIVLTLAVCLLAPPMAAHAGAYEDFFKAVATDDAGGVQALLQRGFDPNSRDEKGQAALYLSLRDGSFKVAATLLQSPQTQVDIANEAGETPLMMAALKGHADWVQRLVERGARIERSGWTPLHYAATGPQATIVAWLLERGAAINARSPNGSTPLMMAARYGSEESAQLLLGKGADARLRNDRQLTAADFARLAGRDKLGERLDQAAR
ncbi:ankyrin repeat domain-containing protein [Aquabacterium sp.]|uniref:ankyrin repeat domain-containing protein n=1 Tax=Aquabacterium sp. TaxID=1872578 RepID=UPI002BDD5758|nr:ankyrin repeat domain-containing protein [Aquabacterium sp.]HSW09145.1 ankyrin repeat domain-containing protein [Aquabacterium sp.]